MNYLDNINYESYELKSAEKVKNPLVLLLRFRKLVQPLGFVDKEEMKKLVCNYIDECAINNFSYSIDKDD